MTMTVGKLHKLFGELVEKGHARKPVCIDKTTFYSPLEQDGATIIGVENVKGPLFIANASEDGGWKENADGSESGRMTIVLEGDNK